MLNSKIIFLIGLLLANCSDNVKVKTVGKMKADVSAGFKIESAANLAVRSDYLLEWSTLAPNLSYGVIIAKDSACTQIISEKKDIKETKFDLGFLADGIYYLCVYGVNRTEKVNASNNGIALTIDRTDPQISIPVDTLSFSKAFDPPLQVQDLTDVTFAWSQMSGPGQVSFGDPKSRLPQVVASKDGIYKIKAVLTDRAGNQSEQIYQFNWDMSGPSVSLGNAVITSKARSLDVVLDSSVVKTKWSFSGGPAGGILTFVEGDNPNAPLISASLEGTYKVILTAYDSAGNTGSASVDFTWDVTPPIFTSAIFSGPATDGFINATEKLLSITLIGALDADGYDQVAYKLVTQGIVCKQVSSYESAVPKSNSPLFSADGVYKICVELKDLAGNVTYGSSPSLTLDTQPASFVSVNLAFEAADGILTAAEHLQSNNLISNIVTYDAYTKEYALVASSISCSGPLSYGTTIPKTDDARFSAAGSFKVCLRVTDQALNPSAYGESAPINYISNILAFTSLLPTAEASDGFVNQSERNATNPLWLLTASGASTISYSVALDDTAGALSCNAGQTYGHAQPPTAASLSGDGVWNVCVKLSDTDGNVVYGKGQSITRDIVSPTLTSLLPSGAASDGYINDSEKLLVSPLWTLSAVGQATASYTLAQDDTAGALSCTAGLTYDQGIATPASLSSDGTYAICVKLTDAAGNTSIGKLTSLVRKVAGPSFTSLLGANEASDGMINLVESVSGASLLTFVGSGYTNLEYSLALSDSPSISCDAGKAYGQALPPLISDLSADGSFAVCTKLSDIAGNIAYGKSQQIIRNTAGPTFTSLVRTAEGSDGFINDSEKNSNSPLWTLSAANALTLAYTIALSDTAGALVCNAAKTYDQGSTIPKASDISVDGAYSLCVKLTDSFGNITYGKGEAIERDIVAPTFTSLALANAAADGYINDSEKLLSSDLWTLSASGQSATHYTAALSDTAGALLCDASKTYGLSAIPAPSSLSADGAYSLCVKLSDAAGNITYGKAVQLTRDSVAPTFTSLAAANGASDRLILAGEEGSALPLFTLSATGHSTAAYTVALSDDPIALVCDASQIYDQASIPAINSISADGKYALCVRLADAAGNTSYGKSEQIERDGTPPAFTSLLAANSASDGYINDSEKASGAAAWSLLANGQTSTNYTVALDDTAGSVVCDGSQTYGQSSIPLISAITVDGTYAICVRLSDSTGNIVYGKSQPIIRDTAAPTFTSLLGANAASDGFINAADASSSAALLSLSASGYAAAAYTVALDNTPAVSCDGSQSYGQASVPAINDLSSDATYVVCVRLTDAAGNISYDASQAIVRLTTTPTMSSLAKAAEGSDGYINNAEKNASNALWTLTASGISTIAYTAALSDTAGALVCDGSQSYTQGTSVARASDLGSDDRWSICVKLTDAAGNVGYGKGQSIIRDTVPPSFTSLALANAAADGYVNDSEKLLTSALFALTASGQASADYTAAANDAGGSLICDGSKSYDQASIPSPSSLASDGTYAVCVKLSDAAGNTSYGKSASFLRDIVPPTLTSFNGANQAADGFIKAGEESSNGALLTLVAVDHASSDYTLALRDDPTPVTCHAAQTYNQSSIPLISSLASDGAYAVCVRLTDVAGNTIYGKSQVIERDVAPPTFTSLLAANAASDGYVNDSEKGSTAAGWALIASGQTAAHYTLPLSDTAASLVCDGSQTYGQSSIPQIDAITSDGPYAICVQLSDAAGNTSYGKSQQVIRDSVYPVFTSLIGANEASDGSISNAEAASNLPLLTLSASLYDSISYTPALVDAPPISCDGSQSYSLSAIPAIGDVGSDDSYAVCAKLTDTAGNTTYGKSQQIVKLTGAPHFTSLARGAEGADGYINNAEKNASNVLWTLSGSGYTAVAYSALLDDSGGSQVCNAADTYDQGTTIPRAVDIPSDGVWTICVKLTDVALNTTYGKAQSITRDTAPPTLSSLALSGAAADGYINDSEKLLVSALWSLNASGHATALYTTPEDDSGSSVSCNAGKTYDQASIATPASLSSDGPYAICVKLSDAAGNITYGKSQQVIRDVVAPTLTSLAPANGASDGFIKSGEESSGSALYTLTASGYSAADFTAALSDTPTAVTCNGTQSYGQATIPAINSISSDGTYAVCVRLSDAAGNLTYGKGQQIVRDVTPPTFTSLNGANGASDGYVNDSEKASTAAAWSLNAAGYSTLAYSLPLDDTAAAVVCNAAKTYDQASIPQIDAMTADKPWAICVMLSDTAGNTTYGKSQQIIRDTVAPTFTSLLGANGAADGYINSAESSSGAALLTLSASGQSTSQYTLALDDSTPVSCNGTQTYGQSTVPVISDLTSDKPWAVCVKLSDAAGNTTYGKSQQIIRDVIAPTFTSLLKAVGAEGADGYINDSEKNAVTPLWTLSAANQTVTAYTLPLDDTGSALVCNAAKTYDQGSTIAGASGLTSDGAWSLCVKLSDAAGNTTYGKGAQIVRDTAAPTLTSLPLTNAASDGYINDSEKALSSVMWTLSAVGHSSVAYTVALDDTGGALSCSVAQTYDQASPAIVSSLSVDGPYALCVRLSDGAGNISYGKSAQVVRDTVAPTFTSLVPANGASDGYIKSGEESAASALYTLTASGYSVADFTAALSDDPTPVSCNSGKTYNQASIPLINSISSDGKYALCVRLSDAAGNISYGKSQQIERDILPPTLTSLNGANGASDGYVNDSEKASTAAGWALVAVGQTTADYTVPLDDTSGAVVCNSGKTYNQSSIPQIDAMTADKPWAICVRLSDAAGNTTYGKSQQIIRDIVAPVFTSLNGANGAADGYINSAESSSGAALLTLSASGQSTSQYTLALDDSTPVSCNGTQTYNQASVPVISDLASDKPWAVCVKLSDAAGNITYGKSQQIIRDVVAPTFTSLLKAAGAEGADGYINDSEKNAVTPLWTLSAANQTVTAYTTALSDTAGALVCDNSQSYNQGTTIAGASGLTSDGAWSLCVKLSDAAGNTNYGKGAQIVRDIVAPTFTSLSLLNAASDGYINDAEKLTIAAMWSLSASGQSATDYTVALDDTSPITCNAAKTYNQAAIAIPSSLSSDLPYAMCVRLSDAAGNITYGKSAQVIRDIVAPTFTSLLGANEASDGYIKSGEQSSNLALYTLTAGAGTYTYTVALDDTSPITCDAGKTYGSSSIPLISSIATDGTYAVCVKLMDAAGNTSYGKSQQVIRDTVAPVFTSLSATNEAADGYIAYAERNSTNAGWTLNASGQSAANYTVPLDDTSGAVVCDSGKTYSGGSIPLINAMTTDGPWAVCVKLSDAAGNTSYGKSQQVIRDTVAPGTPSSLTATAGNRFIDLKWTASTGTPAGYIIARGPAGSAPTFAPTGGTSYTAGLQGSDTLIYVGAATLGTDKPLNIGSTYNYKIYAYDLALNYSAAASTSATPLTPCASNYVFVAGDPDYGTTDFCIMKYEAKNVGGFAASQASSTAWVSISMDDAVTQCAALGTSYQLIDNGQWMTTVSTLAAMNSSWTGGSVGSGQLFIGHTDNNPTQGCAASTDDSLYFVETNCTPKSSGDTAEQKRTFTLPDGEVIWDLSGNYAEKTFYYNHNTSNSDNAWHDQTEVTGTTTLLKSYLYPTHAIKSFWNDSWTISQGLGYYAANTNIGSGTLLRSGMWNDGSNAGLFYAGFWYTPVNTMTSDSFRCAQNLPDLDAATLALAPGNGQVSSSWTATGGASGYILVRGAAGSLPSFQPINGTSYTAGAQGSDQIVYAGSSLSAIDSGLDNNKQYYYALYSYDGSTLYSAPARSKEIPRSCPRGFVAIPGDKDYGTDDFCLMKYEAKNIGGVAASMPEQAPWVAIHQFDSMTACSAMGVGYHLVSNAEWLTAANNIAALGSNWSSGTVGTGNLYRGHSDNNPAYVCPASSSDSLAFVENNCDPKASGQGENDETTQRRTFNLSNGQILWDMAGSAAEWISYINAIDKATPVNSTWVELPSVTSSTAMPTNYVFPTNAVKAYWNNTWNSSKGTGTYFAGTNGNSGGGTRSGTFFDGADAGIFYMFMSLDPFNAYWAQGFRCAYSGGNANTPQNFTAKADKTSVALTWAQGGSATAGYLLVRGPAGSLPVFTPSNGTSYTTGTQGNDTIIFVGNGTIAQSTGLTTASSYNYRLFAYDAGYNYSSPALQSAVYNPCGSGFVLVPGDSDYGTTDFCIMKYEATTASSIIPLSLPNFSSWTNVDQQESGTRCAALGQSYHLVSNSEWMTATVNIATGNSNWTGGTVGSGSLIIGHSDGNPDAVCAASSNDSSYFVENDCTALNSGDTAEQRRTFNLSNGNVAWDLSGNATEWVNYVNVSDKPAPRTTSETEMNAVTASSSMPVRFLYPSSFKAFWNNTWNSSQGVGKYVANANGSGGAMIRGGWENDTDRSGIFRASLSNAATDASSGIGFRCAQSIGDADTSALSLLPASSTSVSASWASTGASGYTLVRGPAGGAPSFVPSNGTSYSAGSQGADTIVYSGSGLSSTDSSLTSGSNYSYALYSYNASQDYTFLAQNRETPPASCPTNHVLVPGDQDYGTSNFCVMKYEAKNVSSVATSQAASTPWVSITQQDARRACTALGLSYDLISNPEWMTIGANAAALGSNWTGASVGSGTLVQGHTDNNPTSACAASTDDSLFYVETTCTPANSGDTSDQKRIHTLSNASVIWDLAGNVWDWVNYINIFDKPGATAANYEYSALTGSATMPLKSLVPTNSVKSYWSNTWNSTQGMGTFYPGTNNTAGALERGGRWTYGSNGGLFTADLNAAPTASSANTGFRCVYHVP